MKCTEDTNDRGTEVPEKGTEMLGKEQLGDDCGNLQERAQLRVPRAQVQEHRRQMRSSPGLELAWAGAAA